MKETIKNILTKKFYTTLEPNPKEKVQIINRDNFMKINILEPCTLEELPYFIKIPIRSFLREEGNLLNAKILKQTLYLFKENKYEYCITENKEQLLLSERKMENEDIMEIELKIDKNKETYRVTKYIHDQNHSTKETKIYPMKEDNAFDFWRMNKKEAVVLLQGLVNRLDKSDKIGRITSFGKFCSYLHLLPDLDFNPVIENDTIALSVSRFYNANAIFVNKCDLKFDIFLKETREKVGHIGYLYGREDGFTYDGNVYYEIEDQFKQQGYATLALELLKDLLLKHQVNSNLYISTLPNNFYSQKVALNNQGEKIYNGSVPEEDKLYRQDGIEEVVVYRIKIKETTKKH